MSDLFRDLARAKATFQARALRAILTTKGKAMTHPTDDDLEAMAERFDRWHHYGYKMPSHIQADGDDAAAMLRACKGVNTPSPAPDVRVTDEMVERAARAMCLQPDRCVVGSGGVSSDGGWSECLMRAWEEKVPMARAALTAALATTGGPQ